MPGLFSWRNDAGNDRAERLGRTGAARHVTLLGTVVFVSTLDAAAGAPTEQCYTVGNISSCAFQGSLCVAGSTTWCEGRHVFVEAWLQGLDPFCSNLEAPAGNHCKEDSDDGNAIVQAASAPAYGTVTGFTAYSYKIGETTYPADKSNGTSMIVNAGLSPEEECENRPGEWIWLEEEQLCSSDSPIVIATGKDQSYRLTSAATGVLFDIDGDGVPEQISWTASDSNVAFLAIDRNGDGKITSGKELFGNYTWPGMPNGFAALRAMNLDTNGGQERGTVSSDDPLFARLLLWTDANHNGVSELSELRPVSELLTDIGLGYQPHRRHDAYGNFFAYRGFAFDRTAPGRNAVLPSEELSRRRHIYDVFLTRRP